LSYQDVETSRQDAEPIELYLFEGSNNSYYFTSYDEDIQFQGQTYLRSAVSRRAVKFGTSAQEEVAIEVSLPYTESVAFEYVFASAPPELKITIFRVHASNNFATDAVVLWRGRVTATTVEGRMAKFRVPSIFGYLFGGTAPTQNYQAPCNHRLYDSRCKVPLVGNRFLADVVSVSGNFVQLDAIPPAFEPQELVAGEVKISTGNEARLVVGQTGTTIEVAYPFSSVVRPGVTLDVRKGCNRALTGDCINRFNNAENYGGFALVPNRNPFEGNVS